MLDIEEQTTKLNRAAHDGDATFVRELIKAKADTEETQVKIDKEVKEVIEPKKQVVQYRLRTLGDGSKMFLPAPGLAAAEPQTFIGRETQILKKHRDLVTAARYSRATDQLQQRDRSPEDRWSADKGPLSRAGRPFRFATLFVAL